MLRDGKPVPLAPKAVDTLAYLVENPARLISRDELLKAIWPDTFVEDGSISVNISLIRKALGDMGDGEPYIDTVPRKGYRFRSDVRPVDCADLRVVHSSGDLAADAPIIPPVASDSQEQINSANAHTEERAHSGIGLGSRLIGSRLKGRLRALVIGAAAVGALLIIGWRFIAALRQVPDSPAFESMQISRLTWLGKVARAVVTPDGKYVVYATNGPDGESLWIRQVAASTALQIAPSQQLRYKDLTISPDSNYLYFTTDGKNGIGVLKRMPLLGGQPEQVLTGVTGPVSFSPDGKQLAFLRIDPLSWEATLLVADADGHGLRRIARRKRPRYFSPWGLAWLPDGKSIVCFAGDAAYYDERAFRIVKIRISDGQERIVSSRSWAWPGSVASSAESPSLTVTAGEQAEDAQQIWHVSLPDGEVSRVTNDLSGYVQLSSSRDAKVLAAVQTDRSADLWVSPSADLGKASPVTSGGIPGLKDPNWTPANQIIYSARTGYFLGIFLLEQGHTPKQLNTEPRNETEVAATPDGRFVIYQSRGKIWRMNQDGTNPVQLTFGAHDVHPEPSPDGQSVLYASFVNWSPSIGGEPTLWSVPLKGGQAKQLTTISTSMPRYSPDGKWIAAAYFPGIDPRFSEEQIVVFHANGGQPVRTFTGRPISGSVMRWAPDSEALDFVITKDGVGNIWRQPIDGGKPTQVTHFTSDLLFDFAWSSGGKQLATVRGKSSSDVILIRNPR